MPKNEYPMKSDIEKHKEEIARMMRQHIKGLLQSPTTCLKSLYVDLALEAKVDVTNLDEEYEKFKELLL